MGGLGGRAALGVLAPGDQRTKRAPKKNAPQKKTQKNSPFIKCYTGYYMKMLSAMLSRKRSCPLEKLPTCGPLKKNEGTIKSRAAQKKNSREQSRKESNNKGKAKKKQETHRKGQLRKGTVKEQYRNSKGTVRKGAVKEQSSKDMGMKEPLQAVMEQVK